MAKYSLVLRELIPNPLWSYSRSIPPSFQNQIMFKFDVLFCLLNDFTRTIKCWLGLKKSKEIAENCQYDWFLFVSCETAFVAILIKISPEDKPTLTILFRIVFSN